MEKNNGVRLEMGSDDVDIKHEPLEAEMEYFVSIKICNWIYSVSSNFHGQIY